MPRTNSSSLTASCTCTRLSSPPATARVPEKCFRFRPHNCLPLFLVKYSSCLSISLPSNCFPPPQKNHLSLMLFASFLKPSPAGRFGGIKVLLMPCFGHWSQLPKTPTLFPIPTFSTHPSQKCYTCYLRMTVSLAGPNFIPYGGTNGNDSSLHCATLASDTIMHTV